MRPEPHEREHASPEQRDALLEPFEDAGDDATALVRDAAGADGFGIIGFTALAQGLLSGKYNRGVPEGSRAAVGDSLDAAMITDDLVERLRGLTAIAERRGQTLPQLALAWALRDERVTSALIGASSVEQLDENLAALNALDFSDDELATIDQHAVDAGINIWAGSSAS